jgi:hypothetical protein
VKMTAPPAIARFMSISSVRRRARRARYANNRLIVGEMGGR